MIGQINRGCLKTNYRCSIHRRGGIHAARGRHKWRPYEWIASRVRRFETAPSSYRGAYQYSMTPLTTLRMSLWQVAKALMVSSNLKRWDTIAPTLILPSAMALMAVG